MKHILLALGAPNKTTLCEGLPTPHEIRPKVSRNRPDGETSRSRGTARSGDLRRTVVSLGALTILAAPSFAAGPVLIPLRETDSAVVILDRETPTGLRPEVVIPPAQSPGRVIVERRPDPDRNDWTEVRWVIRFDLSKAPATITQSRLHLWCQGTAGTPGVSPKLELIESADSRQIVHADRTSKPLLPTALEIPFPASSQMIELDVTPMVKEVATRKLPFAAFRISAVCEKADCGSEPQNFYFGGSTNVWSWPQSEPPVLELSP